MSDYAFEQQVIKDVFKKHKDRINKECVDLVIQHNVDRSHTDTLVMYSRLLKELKEIEQDLLYHFSI